MIKRVLSSKVGLIIVLVIFAYAFSFLLPFKDFMTLDYITRSGVYGFGFVKTLFSAFDTIGAILSTVYTYVSFTLVTINHFLKPIFDTITYIADVIAEIFRFLNSIFGFLGGK